MIRKSFIIKLSVAFIILSATFFTVQAQDKCGVSMHVNGLLPIGQFRETPECIVPGTETGVGHHGAAEFGAGLGFRYNYRFQKTRLEYTGLGIFASVDVMWNALNKTARKSYDSVSCTKPHYINVPMIVGISYTSTFRSVANLYVEAGIGCDLFFKTTEGWSGNTTKYKMSPQFAAEGGIGVIFAEVVGIGVHYYWCGKHNLEIKGKTYPNKSDIETLQISQLAFRVSVYF